MNDILQNDVLFFLRVLPEFMLFKKFCKIIGMLIITFFCITALICVYVLLTNLNKQFWKQYCLLTFGSAIGFSCYAVIYLKKNEYMEMRTEIFPQFWPLECAGHTNYKQICKTCKIVNIFVVVTLFFSFATSTAGLPWYGDEYDIMLPVRVYTDYLGTYSGPVLAFFYLSVYHMGFTMMSTAFALVHFALHLKFQYYLLGKRLFRLSMVRKECVIEELVYCIRYHQQLIQMVDRLNNFIYFPIFLITISSIFFSVSVVFYLKDFENSFLRGFTLATTGILVTAGFCVTGQILENESEKLHDIAASLPWHVWNPKNQKLLLILLVKSRVPVKLSSSGIITINHTLFISLYRKITSVLSFFMNV